MQERVKSMGDRRENYNNSRGVKKYYLELHSINKENRNRKIVWMGCN